MISNRQLFQQFLAQTSSQPLMLEIERAEGINLWTPEKKRYIDLISGISVSNVGHSHPDVLKAIKAQMEKYMHLMVYGEIVQAPQVQLAKALAGTLPSSLNNVYFVNSGSEAVEGAVKLTKRFNRRKEIVSFLNAYHGSSHGALSLMGYEPMKRNFRPLLPGIRHLKYNHENDLLQITEETSAVIFEPIQGEAGVRELTVEFAQKLEARCRDKKVLLIADEIQTGFGRTGKFWGFENFGIKPDIIVCAKGMGGGMPLGAFISSKEIMNVLSYQPVLGHITTFGGHPMSCAASLATLNIIHRKEFLEAVTEKGVLFKKLLTHKHIREVRGRGLFMAIQLSDEETVKKVIEKALDKGLLIDWFLFCADSIRLAPPLTITKEEIEECTQLILSCLNEI